MPLLKNENEVFLFVASDYSDVKADTKFDIIFPYQNQNEFQYTSIVLKYISVNPSYEIDYIPKGYSALCLFEFETERSTLLSKLAVYMDKKDSLKNGSLIITQQPLFDRLMEVNSNEVG